MDPIALRNHKLELVSQIRDLSGVNFPDPDITSDAMLNLAIMEVLAIILNEFERKRR